MPNINTSIKGVSELIAKFKQLDKACQGRALVNAATAGILPIQDEMITTVAVDTHTLQRSIHTETIESSETYAEVATGTDVEYAAAVEFGRTDINYPAQPFARPAFDNRSSDAIQETQAALMDLINAISGG